MSEVKRYDCTNGKARHCYGCYEMTETNLGDYVKSEDFDRVTAERDAALRQLEAEAQGADRAAEAMMEWRRDYMDLQQRLTAAHERADVLEVALGGMLFAFDDGVGREWSEDLLDFARKLTAAKEFKAALKPAEGSTCNQVREESGLPVNTPCQACGRGACIDR